MSTQRTPDPPQSQDETRDERSSFARPGFIGAGVLVAALVAAGAWLSITGGTDPAQAPAPAATSLSPTATEVPSASSQPPAATSTVEAGPAAASDSVCGLAGDERTGTLDRAPAGVSWAFEGRSAYPLSAAAGPGRQDPAGWRSCFARTPEGAVTAAAYFLAIGNSSDYARKKSWAQYGLAASPIPEPQRVQAAIGSDSSPGSRVDLLGFRLLSYSGAEAQVELAMRISLPNGTSYYAAVFPLRWEDGDWKVFFAQQEDPFGLVQLPDLAGYVPWSQGNG